MNAQAEQMKIFVEELVAVVGGRSSGRAKRLSHQSSKKEKGSDRIPNVHVGKPLNAKTASKIYSNGGMNPRSGDGVMHNKLIPFDEEKLTDF
jgi:hypothetical protein